MKGKKTARAQARHPEQNHRALKEAIAESRQMPLDYMLSVMRDEHVDLARRDEMAIAAAHYLHPHLQSVVAGVDAHVIRSVEASDARVKLFDLVARAGAGIEGPLLVLGGLRHCPEGGSPRDH
jgi:hypothetical protein